MLLIVLFTMLLNLFSISYANVDLQYIKNLLKASTHGSFVILDNEPSLVRSKFDTLLSSSSYAQSITNYINTYSGYYLGSYTHPQLYNEFVNVFLNRIDNDTTYTYELIFPITYKLSMIDGVQTEPFGYLDIIDGDTTHMELMYYRPSSGYGETTYLLFKSTIIINKSTLDVSVSNTHTMTRYYRQNQLFIDTGQKVEIGSILIDNDENIIHQLGLVCNVDTYFYFREFKGVSSRLFLFHNLVTNDVPTLYDADITYEPISPGADNSSGDNTSGYNSSGDNFLGFFQPFDPNNSNLNDYDVNDIINNIDINIEDPYSNSWSTLLTNFSNIFTSNNNVYTISLPLPYDRYISFSSNDFVLSNVYIKNIISLICNAWFSIMLLQFIRKTIEKISSGDVDVVNNITSDISFM